MAALASYWLRHFILFLWNRWTEFKYTWQEARSQRPLPSLCFGADHKNKIATLAFDWLSHFLLLLWNFWTEFNETFWQEAKSLRPLPCLYFLGRSVNKNWRPCRFLKKVARCTQVIDMWPFGPLVSYLCSTYSEQTEHVYCRPTFMTGMAFKYGLFLLAHFFLQQEVVDNNGEITTQRILALTNW